MALRWQIGLSSLTVVVLSVLVALGPLEGGAVDLAALCWTIAFALFVWRAAPWLVRPRVGRKAPSTAPS